MVVETVKMSTKGQIVIPRCIREELHLGEGSIFAVASSEDSIVLKKIKKPSKEQILQNLQRIAEEGTKNAERLGIKEKDVPDMIHRLRGVKP
ncbi:MAG: AbrB/MazE/SpoVT family DNA-binding domain-containing protein [archaeon]